MIKGSDIIIKLDGVAVAACKSNDINLSNETIEVCSPTSATAREYISGRSNWSLSSSNLISTLSNVIDLRGKRVSVTITSGEDKYTGTAIVTNVSVSAPHNNIASASISLQGAGALTKVVTGD